MNKVRSFLQSDQARDGRKGAGSSYVCWQGTGGKEKLNGFPRARQDPRFCDSHRESSGLLSKSQLPLDVLIPCVSFRHRVFCCHHLSDEGVEMSRHLRRANLLRVVAFFSDKQFQKHRGLLKI